MIGRAPLVAAAAVFAGVALTAGAASPAKPGCPRWEVVDELGYLAVAGSSSGSVWLVGSKPVSYAEGVGTFARAWTARWDGRRLQVVKNPVGVGELLSVVVTGPTDAWAAGSARGGPLVEHWDGREWRIVAPPPVQGGLQVEVVGGRVWVLAGNDRIYERVRGGWALQRGSPRAHEIHGAPPHDAWADWAPDPNVAGGIAYRWNGHRWSRIAGTRPFVQLAPRTADDVWATQARRDGSFVLVHREGSRWRDVATRAEPIGVDAASAQNVYVLSRRGSTAMLERLSGGRWTAAVIPKAVIPYNAFEAVAPEEVWLTSGGITARYGC